MTQFISRRQFGLLAVAGLAASQAQAASPAHIPVPGAGQKIARIGDDFEDPKWEYIPNGTKSSYNLDKKIRVPGGIARNDLWFEAALRGQPDVVKRVTTPEGGIPGSEGSLMLATLNPGIPGHHSPEAQQDDIIHNVKGRLGGALPVFQTPSITTRVYIPAMEKWERRNGSSFGFRAGLRATHTKVDKETKVSEREEYWPGFFIQHNFKQDQYGGVHAKSILVIRSDLYGRDIEGPEVDASSWWTLGMSFTSDGQVHYFAKAGIDDLTAEDYLASHFPYKYRAYALETLFYNVITADNGRTWSTPWIVDDPAFFMHTPVDRGRMASPGQLQR